MRGRIQKEIVGDKSVADAGEFLLFDNRMAACENLDVAAAGIKLRTAIVAQCGNVRQGR